MPGIDIIDEISRYGKVQENKLNTHFCKMRMLYLNIFLRYFKRDKKTLTNFSGHLINDFKLNSIFSYSHYVEANLNFKNQLKTSNHFAGKVFKKIMLKIICC